MKSPMLVLQPLGRALMLPIAVLPVAALMLRLGQPDLLNIGFVSAAGAAIFDNLGLLFAVGVATGFARDGNGAACLAGIVCYLVTSRGAEVFLTIPPDVGAGLADEARKTVDAAWRTAAIHKFDVPIGIVSGLLGGVFYNRFAGFKLPDYLAFFAGRRFVPIVSGVTGLLLASGLGLAYAPLAAGVDGLSHGVVNAGGWGLFAYGLLNRLLIVTGLHHILNNVAYFIVGDWHGTTGDLRRFFAGDPSAGAFMSGFFPVMMFGLPAACLAMYHEALPDRRKAVAGLLLSLALTSFLTGVTEPIEFSFMFVAPLLYGIHALLTGLSEVIMNALGVRMGFGFSAGLFDYVLNFGLATRPLLLLPVGAAYALAYYAIFRFAIRRWNLPTPGREAAEAATIEAAAPHGARGPAFVKALGGAANLREVGACTTRLRLIVEDQGKVEESGLKALGARGILKPSAEALQVVLGPIADAVAMDIRAALDRPLDTPPELAVAADNAGPLPDAIARLLGGPENIRSATPHHGRWRVELVDANLVSEPGPQGPIRSIARVAPNLVHVLVN
jgi:N-acetylglucosamine PTS system EIICBA or EIICB component